MPSHPLDLIHAAHFAFRRDVAAIDEAALAAAQGQADVHATIERFRFLREMLGWHARGEDEGIFPALDAVAPSVVHAYVLDHHGHDEVLARLADSVRAKEPLRTARATAAFRFHLEQHLHKEDVHLYPMFLTVLPREVQNQALPADRMGDFVRWLFPLLDAHHRRAVVEVWRRAMPPEVFADSLRLVGGVLGADEARLLALMPA